MVGWDGTILTTHDGGSTWERQNAGTPEYLWGIYFVDRLTGWAVGQDLLLATRDGGVNWSLQHIQTSLDGGLSFSPRVTGNTGSRRRSSAAASAPFSMASILPARRPAGRSAQAGHNGTRYQRVYVAVGGEAETASDKGTEEVDVSFKISGDRVAPIHKVSLEARSGAGARTDVGNSASAPDADARWHVVWKPSSLHIEKNSPIDYRVIVDDGGPALAPIPMTTFIFRPSGTFWQQTKGGCWSALRLRSWRAFPHYLCLAGHSHCHHCTGSTRRVL